MKNNAAMTQMPETLDAIVTTDADRAMRNWQGTTPGRIAIGSDAHRQLFCRMLLDTHNPYKPAIMVWPKLAPDALKRITSLPIWDIAVQTEGRAMLRARAYADTVTDPLCSSITVTPLTAPAIAGVTVTLETTESPAAAPPRATSRIVEPRSRRPTVASCGPGAVPPPSPPQPRIAAIETKESRLRAWRAIDALGRDEERNCRRTYPEQTLEHAFG